MGSAFWGEGSAADVIIISRGCFPPLAMASSPVPARGSILLLVLSSLLCACAAYNDGEGVKVLANKVRNYCAQRFSRALPAPYLARLRTLST